MRAGPGWWRTLRERWPSSGAGWLGQLVRPPLLGAAYQLALLAWSAQRAAGDTRVAGVEASNVTSAIGQHFGHHVRDVSALLGAVAVVAGLLLGAVASGIEGLRAWLVGEERPEPPYLQARAMLLIVALHAGAVALAMAHRPQLYEDVFYASGGALRLAQVTCTDVLGRAGVGAVLATLLLAYLVGGRGRLRRIAELARTRARSTPWARRAGVGAPLVGALLLLAQAPRWPAEAHADERRPNLLILAADSLRADRIRTETAPRLTALARAGVQFEHAYVSLPRTFPSWVTILTGRYPHRHGIRNMFPSRAARARDFDAVPARLRQAGYATSVVSDYAGDIFPRIELGFAEVDAPTFHLGELVRQRALEAQVGLLPFLDTRAGRALVPSMLGLNRAPDADGVARRTLRAIDRAQGRPFLVVAFFSTAHFPYASPAPGYRRFTDPSYRGRFKYQKANVLGREAPLDDDDRRQIRALYDGAVTTVDDAMGQVLDGLSARGLDRSTVVVVTADHGETLFENDRGHGHGDHLFGEEALSVPLLVRDGRAPQPRRVDGLARDIDLAPTLYELAGVARPGDLDGQSLVPALGGAPLTTETAFAETGLWFTEDIQGVPPGLRLPYPDLSRMGEIVRGAGDDVVLQPAYFPLTVMAKHRALRTRDRKLVLAPTRQGLRAMLFDPAADPANLRDLAAAEPETTARLRATLLDWILRDPMLELRGEHLLPRAGASGERSTSDAFRLEGP